MAIISFIIFGAVIGMIARLIKPGRQNLSIPATIALGVVGALIGGTVATLIGSGKLTNMDLVGSIVSVIAAFLLIGTAEKLTGGKKTA